MEINSWAVQCQRITLTQGQESEENVGNTTMEAEENLPEMEGETARHA